MKDKTLYLECYSGISGDMTVAALLDLGADQEVLRKGLQSLPVEGYHIEITRRAKNSIDACDFNVVLDKDNHDHDLDYLHSHNDSSIENHHPHSHDHNHDHNHPHDHSHPHNHSHPHDNSTDHTHSQIQSHTPNTDHSHEIAHVHHHNDPHTHYHSHSHCITSAKIKHQPSLILGHHEHRNLTDINTIIDQAGITINAKAIAKNIFYIIAVAEAKAHAKTLEEVHFHEVGAIDSIVDIVATAICLDNLNIKNVFVSELYEGTGTINCQHGMLPIPVPAVANISSEYQLPLHITGVKGELVTPTGAAIVAAIKTSDTLPSDMKILKIGLGAGKRNYVGVSGILRAMLIEDCTLSAVQSNTITDKVWVLEANIDDCTGEALAAAMELLFQAGARDVYYTPIYMKKNRPAYLLGVICTEDKVNLLEDIIFINTTTIGIRKHEATRTILQREQRKVATPYGDALVKVCAYKDKSYYYPEYESIMALCRQTGQDYLNMYHLVQSIAMKQP